jgi:hypothetical protein
MESRILQNLDLRVAWEDQTRIDLGQLSQAPSTETSLRSSIPKDWPALLLLLTQVITLHHQEAAEYDGLFWEASNRG